MSFQSARLITRVFKWTPLVISIFSLIFTGLSLRRQSRESELQLWNSMRREFDHELKKERHAAAVEFLAGKSTAEYSNVMDYFETLGFLVRIGRIDADLFDNTWGYYFSGYFQGFKTELAKEQTADPRTYADVMYLARHFAAEPTLRTPTDLKEFFEEEKNLPD